MIFYTRILPLLLLAAAAFFGGYAYKKNTPPLKIAAIVCLFNLFSELVGNTMGLQGIKNIWWYNGSDLIRYTLWLYFFYSIFDNRFQKMMASFFLFSLPLLWLTNVFYQPITEMQGVSFITGGLMLMVCCFIFLFNEYQSDSTTSLYKDPLFWISTGLLLYHAFNLPFIGLYNWLNLHAATFTKQYFYICVLGSSIVLSIFMIKAFVCSLPNRKYGL